MSAAFFAGIFTGMILTFVSATALMALIDLRDVRRREALLRERAKLKHGANA